MEQLSITSRSSTAHPHSAQHTYSFPSPSESTRFVALSEVCARRATGDAYGVSDGDDTLGVSAGVLTGRGGAGETTTFGFALSLLRDESARDD